MVSPDHEGFDRRRLAGLAAAIGAISAVGTSLSLGMPLLAVILEQRGHSSSVIGLVTTAAGVAALLSTPFVPMLTRRFGAAWVLLVAVVLGTLTFPLFYVFDSIIVWFVLRFVFSLCLNTAFIVSEFWINALAPAARRGFVMGVYATILSIGFAVGPAILSLIGSEGWLPFAVGTGLMAVSVLPIIAGFRADPPMHEGQGGNFLHFLTVVPLGTFAAFTVGAVESSIMSFSPVYGLRLGYSEQMAALLVMAVAIGNIVAQLPLGMLSDRMDRRHLLLYVALGGIVSAGLVAAVSSNGLLLMIVIGLWGGLVAGLYAVGLTHLGARLSGSDLASANAAFVFMYSVGMLVGPAATGAGMDALGPQGLVIVTAVILAGYAGFALFRIRRVPEPKAGVSTSSS
ncbi:MFS transporter [Pleomorphomonas diazotrophica]|uniref:MFS transporter n=1 Tax=Pleomorphomonas diazotrophica TaxID=1166257 RepID=A0A1I4QW86_9HYPH|nr:MFS transporter [Pleomorphomonas diazotrophica]PKR90384.1 MFS transporter [Pleomorphomonas diazotrophica]SFM44271.1 Predicted arabinose efflux permease, MFS family [Pleomorphomonas diazotrophica]